jgi:hypothetical protein
MAQSAGAKPKELFEIFWFWIAAGLLPVLKSGKPEASRVAWLRSN